MHSVKFSRSIWKKLHRAENIYTGTACGACDKYRVCHDQGRWGSQMILQTKYTPQNKNTKYKAQNTHCVLHNEVYIIIEIVCAVGAELEPHR